jgi:hypothetical protein
MNAFKNSLLALASVLICLVVIKIIDITMLTSRPLILAVIT